MIRFLKKKSKPEQTQKQIRNDESFPEQPKCGRPLQENASTPLDQSMCLGNQRMDGFTKLPNGKMERVGGYTAIFYDHNNRKVDYLQEYYGAGKSEKTTDTLTIPPEITTKESLVAYIRKERQTWMLSVIR